MTTELGVHCLAYPLRVERMGIVPPPMPKNPSLDKMEDDKESRIKFA